MEISNNLGYKNIDKMDAKGFISWNSSIAKFVIQSYKGNSKADEVPFEDLIKSNYKGEDSFTGVCRHYAAFLKETFDVTKHLNEYTKDMECLIVGNKADNHVWNMYLMQGKSGIISTETDVYKTDLHEEGARQAINGTGNSMDDSTWIGMYDKNNTRYGAGMRWQKSDFWNKHKKEHTGNRYSVKSLNK